MLKFWEVWYKFWCYVWCPETRIEVLMTSSGEPTGYKAQHCYDEWNDRYTSIESAVYPTLEEAKGVIDKWRKDWIENRVKELQREKKRYIKYP